MTGIYTFDKQKIIRLVCSLSHTHKEDSQIVCEACDYACGYLGSILKREPQTSEETSLCEWAAMAIAVNEVARLQSSLSGGDCSVDTEASKKLLEGALHRLEPLIGSQDFFFEGVNG